MNEIELSRSEVERIHELLRVMNEQITIVDASEPGSDARREAWRKYKAAQEEIERLLPPQVEPIQSI
jgi:hypothetical protein